MTDLRVQASLPFSLEKVGKLTVSLPEAQKATSSDGYDKAFVSTTDQDNYVIYGKEGNFKDARVGATVSFVDENGTTHQGTLKGFQDVDNTFTQGFSRTVHSAIGKIAMVASPLVGGAVQLSRIGVIKAAAANAAEKSITPGTLGTIFRTFVRVPTHYPSAAEIEKVRSAAMAGVKPKNVILTGLAVGAAIGLAIPIASGIMASNNTPDETKIKDVTGKTSLEDKIKRALKNGENVENIIKEHQKTQGKTDDTPQVIIINQEKTVVVKEKHKEDKTLEHLETAGEVAKGIGKAGEYILKTLTHDHN